MATLTRLAVWQRAALKAEQLAAAGQTWTFGRRGDRLAVWAAGPGLPTYTQLAEPGAIAVVLVEGRKPEAMGDDDLSLGGFYLAPDGSTVRKQSHASVFRGPDGALRLGGWNIALTALMADAANEVRDWS